MSRAEEITRELGGRWNAASKQGYCNCPAHDDDSQSMSIGIGRDAGQVLFKCNSPSDCSYKDIIAALRKKGIEVKPKREGLTVEQYASAKILRIPFLTEIMGLSNGKYFGKPAVVIPYKDETGAVAATRYRTELKKPKVGKDNRFFWERDGKVSLYGLERLPGYRAQNLTAITLVEGESDTHTLVSHDIAVLGIPGATSWNEERDAGFFDSFETVYLVVEPDSGGSALRERLGQSKIRQKLKFVRLPEKDPSDLHRQSVKDFPTAWQAALDVAEAWTDEPDPLEDLIQRTEADAGVPFEPRILKRLLALRTDNPAAYERVIQQLKKANVRIVKLEKAVNDQAKANDKDKPNPTDLLVQLALNQCELFRTPQKEAFADIKINGIRKTISVRSKTFKLWLARVFYNALNKGVNGETIGATLNTLEARARFDCPEIQVFPRVAQAGNTCYLDLATELGEVVEITAAGWRVIQEPPVRFRVNDKMRPLPIPVSGGSINELRPFLNVNERGFILAIAWLLAALRSTGPYPIMAFRGEHGVAKTTTWKLLRRLIDDFMPLSRSLPKTTEEMFRGAKNQHIQGYENLSAIPGHTSDAMCRLASGSGSADRELYTNDEEISFEGARPIVFDGIEDMVERPDLANRCLLIMLEPIAKEKRRAESELYAAFDKIRPTVLGALLDGVVTGLRELPNTELAELPRMADFALWVVACEKAFWDAGTFMEAYTGNLEETNETLMESDPVAKAIQELMTPLLEPWKGTATELLEQLSARVLEESIKRHPKWPKIPSVLSGTLRRLAPPLRDAGIIVEWARESGAKSDGKRTKIIEISKGKPANYTNGKAADEPIRTAEPKAEAPKDPPPPPPAFDYSQFPLKI
jgi:hypothetical protein